MIRYSAKRLARSMLTLFIIITVVFSLLRLMPVEGYFQNYEKMNDAQIQNGLRQLGLLDPLPVQLMNFYKQVLHGDLGVSNIYRMNVPITQIVAEKAPVSMMMGGMALCISLLLGLPMGAAMARGKGKWFDKIGTGVRRAGTGGAKRRVLSGHPAVRHADTRLSAPDAVPDGQPVELDPANLFPGHRKYRLLCHVAAPLYGGRIQQGLCHACACQGRFFEKNHERTRVP